MLHLLHDYGRASCAAMQAQVLQRVPAQVLRPQGRVPHVQSSPTSHLEAQCRQDTLEDHQETRSSSIRRTEARTESRKRASGRPIRIETHFRQSTPHGQITQESWAQQGI